MFGRRTPARPAPVPDQRVAPSSCAPAISQPTRNLREVTNISSQHLAVILNRYNTFASDGSLVLELPFLFRGTPMLLRSIAIRADGQLLLQLLSMGSFISSPVQVVLPPPPARLCPDWYLCRTTSLVTV